MRGFYYTPHCKALFIRMVLHFVFSFQLIFFSLILFDNINFFFYFVITFSWHNLAVRPRSKALGPGIVARPKAFGPGVAARLI